MDLSIMALAALYALSSVIVYTVALRVVKPWEKDPYERWVDRASDRTDSYDRCIKLALLWPLYATGLVIAMFFKAIGNACESIARL